MERKAKKITNAIVGQNFELPQLIAELTELHQKHGDECDRVMVVIEKASFDDYAFTLFLETDEETEV